MHATCGTHGAGRSMGTVDWMQWAVWHCMIPCMITFVLTKDVRPAKRTYVRITTAAAPEVCTVHRLVDRGEGLRQPWQQPMRRAIQQLTSLVTIRLRWLTSLGQHV